MLKSTECNLLFYFMSTVIKRQRRDVIYQILYILKLLLSNIFLCIDLIMVRGFSKTLLKVIECFQIILYDSYLIIFQSKIIPGNGFSMISDN